jgi:hypothetical protein
MTYLIFLAVQAKLRLFLRLSTLLLTQAVDLNVSSIVYLDTLKMVYPKIYGIEAVATLWIYLQQRNLLMHHCINGQV